MVDRSARGLSAPRVHGKIREFDCRTGNDADGIRERVLDGHQGNADAGERLIASMLLPPPGSLHWRASPAVRVCPSRGGEPDDYMDCSCADSAKTKSLSVPLLLWAGGQRALSRGPRLHTSACVCRRQRRFDKLDLSLGDMVAGLVGHRLLLLVGVEGRLLRLQVLGVGEAAYPDELGTGFVGPGGFDLDSMPLMDGDQFLVEQRAPALHHTSVDGVGAVADQSRLSSSSGSLRRSKVPPPACERDWPFHTFKPLRRARCQGVES